MKIKREPSKVTIDFGGRWQEKVIIESTPTGISIDVENIDSLTSVTQLNGELTRVIARELLKMSALDDLLEEWDG